MNQRIQELAEEAGFRYIKDEGIGWAGNHNASLPRFAELIVRECADILDPNGAYAEKYKHAHVPGPDGSRTPLSTTELENMLSAQKLREHFGVE